METQPIMLTIQIRLNDNQAHKLCKFVSQQILQNEPCVALINGKHISPFTLVSSHKKQNKELSIDIQKKEEITNNPEDYPQSLTGSLNINNQGLINLNKKLSFQQNNLKDLELRIDDITINRKVDKHLSWKDFQANILVPILQKDYGYIDLNTDHKCNIMCETSCKNKYKSLEQQSLHVQFNGKVLSTSFKLKAFQRLCPNKQMLFVITRIYSGGGLLNKD